jgi:hypothetical protein
MATKGRGGDSMLVHMTPGEVQALQALAQRHGGTLTINPETGQPEANFLKKILPAIAGFALGPAGFGLSAGMAGLAVGGVSALATGSLSRGLMAGLGAYGGAGLGAGLANAGTGAMAASDIAAQQAAGTFPTMAEGMTAEAYASKVGAARDAALAKAGEAGFGAKMSAGFGQMASNPGMYGREILTGLAAISPMMADQGVQTTTKRPDTGMIRNYTFDPYGQTYSSAGNYPASEYKGMAQGGIVALAEGGGLKLPEGWGVAGGKYDDPAEKIAYFNQQNITPEQLLSANQGVTQADIDWMKTQGYASNTIAPGSNQYVQNVQNWFESNPTATYQDIQGAIGQYNLNPEDVKTAMQNAGLSVAAQFAAFNPDIGPASNVEETYGGLKGMSSNINYWLDTHPRATLIDFKNAMSEWGLNNADILRATGKTPEQLADQRAANAAAAANVVTSAGVVDLGTNTGVTQDKTDTTTTGINALAANIPGAITSNITTDGQYTGTTGVTDPVGTKVGQGTIAGSGSEANTGTRGPIIDFGGTPGFTTAPLALAQQQIAEEAAATTTAQNAQLNLYRAWAAQNPNATDAEAANFMDKLGLDPEVAARATSLSGQQMKNRYFDAKYNMMTGDSLSAYNYLAGKGANPATQQRVGETMRPYSEAKMGIPAAEGRPTQKFIFENGKYVANPNYRPLSYNSKGERIVGLTSTEVLKGLQGLANPTDDVATFDWMTANNVTVAQLAAALNISFAEAQARYNAAKAKKAGTAAGTSGGGGGGGGGSAGDAATTSGFSTMGTNNAPVSAMGGDTGFGDSSVGSAGGGGDTGDAPGSDGTPGSGAARGGLLPRRMALGGLGSLAGGGQAGYNLGGYSDGGRLLKGPGDGVSDSIPATIGDKQPARLADGEFVVPARIVSELGNGSTEAGARKLYAMMDRVQKARGKTTGKNRVAANTRSDKYLPA